MSLRRHLCLGFACLLLILCSMGSAHAAELPRTILALYDSKVESKLRFSNAHQFSALPLNHLGLVVEYHDIRQPLPQLAGRKDLRGVLTWLSGSALPDANALWSWLASALDQDLRLVIMGDLPLRSESGADATAERVNVVLRRIGFQDEGQWDPVTLGTKLRLAEPGFDGFERGFDEVLPPFSLYRPIDGAMHSHLVARRSDGSESHLVMTGRRGGFAATGFIFHRDPSFLRTRWHIDPFAFFARAFATEDMPKPDTTTLSGRRMYYSHVDGDGWLNISSVPAYAKKRVPAAQVILNEVAQAYPDLPVTIAPVAAELDPEWHGSVEAMRLAQQFFLLPNVEPASHTYSHPFQWSFFESYSPEREAPFRSIYRASGQQRYGAGSEAERARAVAAAKAVGLSSGYRIPRAYGDKPFDVTREIAGSLAFIAALAPPNKPPRLIQWPGDTSPFREALALTRMAGALNINGGDSRFDREYPSYSSLAPLGLLRDGELQIYASNSNENTYTELWTSRFFGQRYVRETWENTEAPRRVSPINLYYHIYSGERLAALTALRENLDWVRRQQIAPVSTRDYAAIAVGFHTAQFNIVGERAWRILNRGEMNTLRFDGALARAVPDYERSRGVLGHRQHQGSLYVALDAAESDPLLLLRNEPGTAQRPILDNARWLVSNLECAVGQCRMQVRGFGKGDFLWRGAAPGRWQATLHQDSVELARQEAVVAADGLLALILPQGAEAGATLVLRRIGP
jgi:hypothetical protein